MEREIKPLVLSVEQTAQTIQVSPWTDRKWLTEGKLPITRLGRRVFVTPEALQEFVNKGGQR